MRRAHPIYYKRRLQDLCKLNFKQTFSIVKKIKEAILIQIETGF